MKIKFFLAFSITTLLISGCATITPIKSLPLPPVTTIEGAVTQLNEHGFTLTDDSGSIFVRAELPGNKKLDVALNEKLKIYGNLQAGPARVFDGYVIRKSTGRQIIVSNPTPHLGCVIQSAFE